MEGTHIDQLPRVHNNRQGHFGEKHRSCVDSGNVEAETEQRNNSEERGGDGERAKSRKRGSLGMD